MKMQQAIALANLVSTIRSDWDQWAVRDKLMTLPGTDAEIAAHAVMVAGDPGNRTLVMLVTIPVRQFSTERPGRNDPAADAPKPGDRRACDICHRTEWACQQAQRTTGLDRHRYRPAGARPADAGELASMAMLADVLGATLAIGQHVLDRVPPEPHPEPGREP